jgi:hypothetical protein
MHRDNTCDRVFNSITTPIRTTRQTHEIRRMSVNDEGCEITDAAQSRQKIHAPHPVARIVMAYNAVFSNWRPGASLSAEV